MTKLCSGLMCPPCEVPVAKLKHAQTCITSNKVVLLLSRARFEKQNTAADHSLKLVTTGSRNVVLMFAKKTGSDERMWNLLLKHKKTMSISADAKACRSDPYKIIEWICLGTLRTDSPPAPLPKDDVFLWEPFLTYRLPPHF